MIIFQASRSLRLLYDDSTPLQQLLSSKSCAQLSPPLRSQRLPVVTDIRGKRLRISAAGAVKMDMFHDDGTADPHYSPIMFIPSQEDKHLQC